MEKINGIIFKGMLESGCNNLNGNKKEVDALMAGAGARVQR